MRRGGWVVVACLTVAAGACGTDRLDDTGTGGRGTGGVYATGGVAGEALSTGGASGAAGRPGPPHDAGPPVDAAAKDGSADASRGIPLTPSATGFVDDPISGLVGSWYPFGDSIGPNPTVSSIDIEDSDCVKKGGFAPSDCSMVTSPIAGQPFAPDPATGAMCTTGVAAVVLPGSNGIPDYSDLWGAGIGLDFNDPGGEAGAKGAWNGGPFTGIAFDFTGADVPVNRLRVLFPFVGEHGGADAPYWQGTSLDHSPLLNDTHVTIHWTDVGGPYYLTQETPPAAPPPFDPTQLLSIQFQVFTNASMATPYSFCITNLTLLTN